MIIKKFTGIMLAVIMLTAMLSMNVCATDIPKIPAATGIVINSADMSGSVNNRMAATINLSIDGNGFYLTNAGWSAKDWFKNLPIENESERNSWTIVVQSNVANGSNNMIITLTGTPTKESTEPIKLEIPKTRIQNGTTNDPDKDTSKNLTKNLDTDISSPTDIIIGADSDLDFKWNIVNTKSVKLVVNKDIKDKINGTLTATATVNSKEVKQTTNSNGEATIYVEKDDKITFTVTPNSRYTVNGLIGPTLTTTESKENKFTRTFDELAYNDSSNENEKLVSVNFIEIPTAYRILEVPVRIPIIGNTGANEEYYTVKQIVEDDKDVTKVYKEDTTSNTETEDNLIVMKFGETAPIIIKKDGDRQVDVKTNQKKTKTDADTNTEEEYYVSPTDIESNYKASYNLTITSKTTAAVKVEVVPAASTTAYNTLLTELQKYKEYETLIKYDKSGVADLMLTPGDLIITPQGAGTSTITITAKREYDSNDPKLNDGKIEFNIKVEAAKTEKDFEPDTGILTAITKNIYGDEQTLTLDINKETAISKDVQIAGYSVNGTSWSSLEIKSTATDIAKIFDKSGKSLNFTTAIASSKSAPGATVWNIGEIGSRPKAPNLKVFYGNPKEKIDAKIDSGTWTVTGFDYESANAATSSANSSVAKLLFASSADKKTVDVDANPNNLEDPTTNANAKFSFILFGEDNNGTEAFPLVKELSDGKVVKSTYLFKLSATWIKDDASDDNNPIYIITPASKTVKLTVSSKLKPTKATVDYKKEKVTLKAGTAYYYGEAIDDIKNKPIDEIIKIIKNDIKVINKSNTKIGILFRDTNENAIDEKELLDNIPNSVSNIIYWTAANGKKPQSAATIITVYNYQAWNTTDTGIIEKAFIAGSGKYKIPKGYEALLANEIKWKTSISLKQLAFGENTIEIRKRGNAKFDTKNTSTWLKAGTNTASESEKFIFTVGNYTTNKGKSKVGITEVKRLNLQSSAPNNGG